MAARNPKSGNTDTTDRLVKLIPIVVIVIGLAAAAYFLWPASTSGPSAVVTTGKPGAAATAASAPATPAPTVELTVDQLLKEASAALREQRMLAPPGNNALEFYLQILAKEPNNQAAQNALRELFPFATPIVEQDINTGALEEATRVIDLLSKADPSNYTLTILRSKLDAKKKLTDREQQQAAAAATAAANASKANNANAENAANATNPAAPAQPAAAATETTAGAAPASRQVDTGAPAATTAVGAAAPATGAPTPAPIAATPAGGETHEAEIVKAVPPDYPPDAARKRLQGWVEVEFTVGADGQVGDATVVGADPPRVFNSEALRAVKRWTFRPKVENGKPMDTRMKRRIEFKLAG